MDPKVLSTHPNYAPEIISVTLMYFLPIARLVNVGGPLPPAYAAQAMSLLEPWTVPLLGLSRNNIFFHQLILEKQRQQLLSCSWFYSLILENNMLCAFDISSTWTVFRNHLLCSASPFTQVSASFFMINKEPCAATRKPILVSGNDCQILTG